MSLYKVTPLCLGYLTRPKKNFFMGYEGDDKHEYPICAYYLEGEHKILVDTGGCAVDAPRGIGAQPYTRTPEQELPAQLAAAGVSVDEIEYVIFTHLHWDHAYNNDLFPKATFICQKKELDFLKDPDTDKIGYVAEDVLKYDYQTVDGDVEIFSGINALLTPGHTVGGQCLIVDTAEGKVVLTGDTITLRESFLQDPPMPNGLYHSEEERLQLLDAAARIAAITKVIYPGHEPGLF